MTTREPGASDVLTHGFVASPRSTAFLASSPAAIITRGFDVLVQLVMAAIATWPWSSSKDWPAAVVTGTRRRGRSALGVATGNRSGAGLPFAPPASPGGAPAGDDPAPPPSWPSGGR